MSKLMISIQIAESHFGDSAEGFFFRHSYLGFLAAFIGIPVLLLGAVTISTIVVVLPLSFLCGWL